MVYDLSNYKLEREVTITGHNFRTDKQAGHTVRIYSNLELTGRGRWLVEYRYDTGAVAHTKHHTYKDVIKATEQAMIFGSTIATCGA